MACNCATSEQIKELYRRYGDKSNKPKRTAKEWVKTIAVYTGVGLGMIVVFPFLVLYVTYKALCDDNHQISLTKFFRLKRIDG